MKDSKQLPKMTAEEKEQQYAESKRDSGWIVIVGIVVSLVILVIALNWPS